MQHLIDLAGSESSKTETIGLRRKEGSYINKSLLTLGTVRYFCFAPCFSFSLLYSLPSMPSFIKFTIRICTRLVISMGLEEIVN